MIDAGVNRRSVCSARRAAVHAALTRAKDLQRSLRLRLPPLETYRSIAAFATGCDEVQGGGGSICFSLAVQTPSSRTQRHSYHFDLEQLALGYGLAHPSSFQLSMFVATAQREPSRLRAGCDAKQPLIAEGSEND